MNLKALVAEFIGTFALIFIGIGSVAALTHGSNLVGAAIAYGVMIAVMVSALGAISGGHFNPAVSFGAWIGHKISTVNLIGYWIAQVAGGVAGAWLLHFCIPGSYLGTPTLSEVNMTQGLVLEAVGTFFLVFVVYGTAIDHRAPKVGGLFIGLTITVSYLCFGPQTGASINPARYLGPALVEGHMRDAVVYILGPLLGATVAGVLYNYFMAERDPDMPVSTLTS
jgi:aquaporin Z